MTDDLFKALGNQLKHQIDKYLGIKLSKMDASLAEMIHWNCVVSGGCFASFIKAEEPNDIDLWAKTAEGMSLLESKLKLLYKESKIEDKTDQAQKYMDVFVDGKIVSSNAITMDNGLQFVTMNTYDDARKSFDYVHCLPYYDISTGKFYISKKQMQCLDDKILVVNNPLTCTEKRKKKFIDRGWRHDALPL